MTAKLIVSILFLLLILEILPKRSEAIANGPGQACKGNSVLCGKTGLMEDDKVHTYNTIHFFRPLSLIVNRCCSRIFKQKTDKSAIFRLRKFFFSLKYSCWGTEQNFQDLPIEASVTTFVLMVDIFHLP